MRKRTRRVYAELEPGKRSLGPNQADVFVPLFQFGVGDGHVFPEGFFQTFTASANQIGNYKEDGGRVGKKPGGVVREVDAGSKCGNESDHEGQREPHLERYERLISIQVLLVK